MVNGFTALDPTELDRLRALIEQEHAELSTQPAPAGLVPLKIACSTSDCQRGRHSLDHLRARGGAAGASGKVPGNCRDCGEHVVDLPHPPAEAVEEIGELVAHQRLELIRDHYWTVDIDLKAYNKAYRLGRIALHARALEEVRAAMSVDKATFDGRQTSYHGDAICYAQHAVGACCRRCVEYWHGMPAGVLLSERELERLHRLVCAYIDLRLPSLPMEATRVASVRQNMLPSPEEARALAANLVAEVQGGRNPVGLLVPDTWHSFVKPVRAAEGRLTLELRAQPEPPSGWEQLLLDAGRDHGGKAAG